MEKRQAIIVAVICLVISLFLINGYVQVRRNELTADFGEEVDVVVASDYIPEYGIIREDKVKVIKVFKKFKQPQTTADMNDVVGKATYVPLYANEQIPFTKLVTQDEKPVLDRQIDKKMRALTLNVSPATGVGRLIRPGNRIDILATVNYDQSGTTLFETKTLIQNVMVLATGKNLQNSVPTRVNKEVLNALEGEFEQRSRKDFVGNTENLTTLRPDDNYSNITVQLTPEDAEKVLFVTHSFGDSRLYFTLRNGADQEIEKKFETALLDDVLGPDSDYGRTKIKPPPIIQSKPKWEDVIGGQARPVY
jgi:pilus assembly protein CpaB